MAQLSGSLSPSSPKRDADGGREVGGAGPQLWHSPLAGLCSRSPLHPSNEDLGCDLPTSQVPYKVPLITRVVFYMFSDSPFPFLLLQDFEYSTCLLSPGEVECRVKGEGPQGWTDEGLPT